MNWGVPETGTVKKQNLKQSILRQTVYTPKICSPNDISKKINIGYVIGLLPTTGLPLPFFSYGGSHTLFTLVSLGILINISSQSRFHKTHRGANIYV